MHTNTRRHLSDLLSLGTGDLTSVVGGQTRGNLRPAILRAFTEVEAGLVTIEIDQSGGWIGPWLDIITR